LQVAAGARQEDQTGRLIRFVDQRFDLVQVLLAMDRSIEPEFFSKFLDGANQFRLHDFSLKGNSAG
jgi:hypothetical protein